MIEGFLIDIMVSPKSSRRGVTVEPAGSVKVFLNSPPVDGKANEECIKLFSKILGIPKSSISIARGHNGRKKTLRIQGLPGNEIISRLASAGKHHEKM